MTKKQNRFMKFVGDCREYSSLADQRIAKQIEMNKLKIVKQKQDNELEKLKQEKPKRERKEYMSESWFPK